MRFLLLTARPELNVNQRLTTAAARRGIESVVVDATAVVAAAGGEPLLSGSAGDLLTPPVDAVLARVGNWRPDSILSALEVAIAGGGVTQNPPAAIRAARDHWRTAWILAAAGIPVPATFAGADPEVLAERGARLGFPVVIKQRRSRMGVGVIRAEALDHLHSVLDSLWRVGDEVVVQRYIPTGGTSLRLLVVGDDVVAAARFTAPAGEWRSNAARGATARVCTPDPQQTELAVAAARALGLGVCGVDLLEAERNVVCEVNPTPGFLRLEDATGVDVADAIIGDLVKRVERSRS